MTRRAVLASATLLAGCGRKRVPRTNLLPEVVGDYKRTSLADASGENEVIPRGSIERAQAAIYQGAGRLDVTLYELTSSAAALDAVQRWRPAANTVFFYRDEFFVVVRYQDADRKAVNIFVRDLDRHLTPPK